jgi:hypothetical protein
MVIGDRLRQLREESPTLPNTPNTQHQPFRKIDIGQPGLPLSDGSFISLGDPSAVDSYFRIRSRCLICFISYGIYTLR